MSESALPLVAFDEAGNTGPDLLNVDQPVFALASVHVDDSVARETLGKFTSKASELKFSTLRKTTRGKSEIVEFLAELNPAQFKATLTHKSYMASAKIVDLLIEPILHSNGIDLYARGGNIAMANVLHACYPVFIGDTAFRELQSHFVQMVRTRNAASAGAFYAYCENICQQHAGSEYSDLLFAILASGQIRRSVIQCKATELDPAVPSFVQHCAVWGEHLGTRFDLLHDESKPIAHEQELLTMLMPSDEPTVTVGADRRKFQLPLKATGIHFAKSHDVPQIQLADLVASSVAYIGRHYATNAADDAFVRDMVDAGTMRLVFDGLWPSRDIEPGDLGTSDNASPEPMMNHLSNVIGGYMRKHRDID